VDGHGQVSEIVPHLQWKLIVGDDGGPVFPVAPR
jgi:hypothetical protein